MVERIVRFETLGTTFIPRIFEEKDQAKLFRNFEDPIDELVKKFYSNARFTRVKLKCWVRGKEFIITPNYIAKVLRITRSANADLTLYDDRLPQVQDILQILGPDHEISSKGTSIGTTKFALELKTLTLIMFFNLYPFSNTRFINLRRAHFLCDLITRIPIDICAHIFLTIGKTTARTCLPFCSLFMKIMALKGVHPLKDGKIPVRLRPISMVSLQGSKSHSSKVPRSESFPRATPSGHGLATHTSPGQIETASPITPELQTTSTQHVQSSSQANRLGTLIEVCISLFLDLKMFSTPPTIKFKCVSRPLRHSQMLFNTNQKRAFSYSCQKGGEQ